LELPPVRRLLRTAAAFMVAAASFTVFAPAALAAESYSGSVFEDMDADAVHDGGEPGVAFVDVRLYADNGNGVPDAADLLADSAATDGSGDFTLTSNDPGQHWVVVDSRDVTRAGAGNAAEQTFGPPGSLCTNGDSPETYSTRGTAGPCFGGWHGDVADGFALGTDAEHIASVSASRDDLDFGFSFNVVTTTRATASQGSLRNFIGNANATAGPNAMRFVPAVPPNAADGAGNSWWRIAVNTELPRLLGAATTIDGTAHDLSDGSTTRDTNGALIGTGETVGAQGIYTTPRLDPELEIDLGSGVGDGLRVMADAVTIRHLSISGSSQTDIQVGDPDASGFVDGTIVEFNVIGTGPATNADPGSAASNRGLRIERSTNGRLTGNLIRFTDRDGVLIRSSSDGWQLDRNEWRGNGRPSDGDLEIRSGTMTVLGNLFRDGRGDAVRLDGSGAVLTADNNTIRDASGAGIIVEATAGSVISRNVIVDNGSSGVVVDPPADDVRISRNHFGGNDRLAIDLLRRFGDEDDDDDDEDGPVRGISPNSGSPGTCGYNGSRWGNDGIDFPVIESAVYDWVNTTVTGTACPDAVVEVYRAAADGDGSDTRVGTGYGEGIVYLGATAADAFGDFTYIDTTLTHGDVISALAIDTASGPGNTSEFSANFVVISGVGCGGGSGW
jgi:hypothetical protein